MAKNIAESIAPEPTSLIPLVSRFTFSHTNYRNRSLSTSSLPDSIQVFSKTEHSQLQSSKGKHFHGRCLVIIPLSGSGRVIVNTQSFALKPGVTLLVPPYHFHHYSEISKENVCWLFLTFKNDDIFSLENPRATIGRCTPLFWADLAQLIEVYRAKATAQSTLQLACRLVLLVTQILDTAIAGGHSKAGKNENLLLQVHRIVIENMTSPLDMDDFAARLGLSESHLRSRFRSITGMSLGNFQRTVRLYHAATLLSNSGCNVSEVAARCGWESPFSFSRSFTNFWGISPKKFAMEKQRNHVPRVSHIQLDGRRKGKAQG